MRILACMVLCERHLKMPGLRMRPLAYRSLWTLPESCMVVTNIFIAQSGSWQLREDKVHSEETKNPGSNSVLLIPKHLLLCQVRLPRCRSAPWHPQDSLRAPQQSWAGLGLTVAARERSRWPLHERALVAPSGPPPTSTAFARKSVGPSPPSFPKLLV